MTMRFAILCLICFSTLVLNAQDNPSKAEPQRSQIEDLATKKPQAAADDGTDNEDRPRRVQTIGIGADLAQSRQNYTISFQGSLLDINAEYIIQPPQFSLVYQRQLLRRFAPLFGELQIRYFKRQETKVSDILVPTALKDEYYVIPLELDEVVAMKNLYFYPGLNYHFSKSREFLAFVGGGLAIAMPIESDRSVTFKSTNYPEFPAEQSLTDIQEQSIGYYFQAGIQLHFPAGIGIGVTLRQESLEQKWAYEPREEVINSRTFITAEELIPANHFLFQCQLLYSW